MLDFVEMLREPDFWYLVGMGILLAACLLFAFVFVAGLIGSRMYPPSRMNAYDPIRHLERLCIYYGENMGRQLFEAGYDERAHPR